MNQIHRVYKQAWSFEVCGMHLFTPVMDLIQRLLFFMRPHFSLFLCQCNSTLVGIILIYISGENLCFSAHMVDDNFPSLFPFLTYNNFTAGAVPLIFYM